jgi:hypothetical protein
VGKFSLGLQVPSSYLRTAPGGIASDNGEEQSPSMASDLSQVLLEENC